MENAHILLVEDDIAQNELIASMLSAEGFIVTATTSVEEAIVALKANSQISLIFSDWKLGQLSGLNLLEFARSNNFPVGIVIATAYGSIDHAALAIEKGADDYLAKPFQRQELLLALAKANKANQLRLANQTLNSQLSQQDTMVELIGSAPCMQKVFQRIEKVASTSATVLISGESGTGKELAARALHKISPRKDSPFIAINCGAIPESIAEAELFGAKKGAFTGANQDKLGKFAAANGGTLFLDEVAELSPQLQTKLLRFLQEGVITPLGCHEEVAVDVRVIAASHKQLLAQVEEGLFREDLYYRLNVVPIHMPALRERTEDIGKLIHHFKTKFCQQYGSQEQQLSATTLKQLLSYSWPGNVRQLSNCIERYALLGDENELVESLNHNSQAATQSEQFVIPDEGIDWHQFERAILLQACKRAENNKTAAAKLLGLSYKAFLYRLEKHQI
ncbi:sigma-54-dependent transcriptional regulator [Pseudoalteromonas piratica]|uniref:Fis family transcriptional regulator n=1 Tax=Pseudoalteromonas piratica TaxID=1348114 RepID=A0A0A7EGI5_9GAMM|nr:sigma-54 dependent transcriptional regulator [Pseudoalteromonas piratica]AIY65805.1 Fis family transcriptional regulator [Pseudoalteromonas piratica]